jgi:hypothetical protein
MVECSYVNPPLIKVASVWKKELLQVGKYEQTEGFYVTELPFNGAWFGETCTLC